MSLSARTKLSVYNTPSVIYDELTRLFVEHQNGGSRWVNIVTREGVEMTLFACDEKAVEPVEEVAA